MNTRNDLGPEDRTDPRITITNTSETSGEDVKQLAPVTSPSPSPLSATPTAPGDGPKSGFYSMVSQPGEINLKDALDFFTKRFGCFLIFARMDDDNHRQPDGTATIPPEKQNEVKREFAVFAEGVEVADPKLRNVVARWLQQTSVRDFSKDRITGTGK